MYEYIRILWQFSRYCIWVCSLFFKNLLALSNQGMRPWQFETWHEIGIFEIPCDARRGFARLKTL